jgi:choline kinase
MQALIMAAGRGSRLGEMTDALPKSLLDLGGITPLEFQIDLLAEKGVTEVIIVTGYRADLVRAAALKRAGMRLSVNPVFNPFWSATNVLGSAWFARHLLKTDFIYLHADTVFEPSILDDMLMTSSLIALPIDLRSCEPEQMKAQIANERVVHLSKELKPELTAGEFIGIGIFRAGALQPIKDAIEVEIASGAIDAYFEAAINRVIIDARIYPEVVPVAGRRWTEIDFAEDLEAARRQLAELVVRPSSW